MKLAIDLGGSNIGIAQVVNGRCLNKKTIPCFSQQDETTVLKQLFQLIDSAMTIRVTGIGIGVPSVVDHQTGIVYDVLNIPSWKEVHLKEILEKRYQLPVAVNNDSNCFALGESLFGEGKPYANMVGVTIGTGIGTGIIINRQLYCGEFTGAGEMGSLPYLDSDFEHYCSSFFFKKYNTTGSELFTKAQQNHKAALDIWEEFGAHLGNFLKAILYTYAPQAIILGGGVCSAFPLFEEAMNAAMLDFPYKVILDNAKIIAAQSDETCLLGASAMVDSANIISTLPDKYSMSCYQE